MRSLLPVVALGLVLVGCSTDSGDSDAASTTARSVTASSTTAATANPSTTAPDPAPSPVTVDRSANGTELDVRPGQRLLIRLPSNPSTGYSWGTVRFDQGILIQDGDPDYQADPGPDMPGKGGTETWAFRAERPGTTTLELVYARPWEEPSDADERFTLTVRVA
ncbi:protease inhibitor I42 family protein [Nocardia otitidiscaviarum]|uniref:protease inhibitor I42 family protein n=1 Tax=Nocardia otitidiscaviarum TaxID=1823 RepID=UPI00245756C1|nr:protease inhibitor I42 family protein [Nocardia otitidiscaviarum]